MDRIAELIARLTDLTADELTELRDLIATEATALDDAETTPETVAAVEHLADALDQVVVEEGARATAAADLEARQSAAADRIRNATTPAGDGDGDGGDPPAGDGDGEDPPAGDPAPADAAPVPVTASGRSGRRPSMAAASAARTHGARTASPATTSRPRSTTTQLDSASTVDSRGGVAVAMAEKIAAFAGQRGSYKHTAVRTVTEYPEDRRLGTDATANTVLVAAAIDQPGALVAAAGGLCAPIENLYDVNVVGSVARPVRNALAPFAATRGGVSLRPSPVVTQWAGAVGTWTMTDGELSAGGDPRVKPIAEALCTPFEEFEVQAITARLRLRNITARFDPEGTAANLEALDIVHARLAENELLQGIADLSLTVTNAKVLGSSRDLLRMCDKVIAYYKSRHRLDDTFRMRAIMPRWVKDMIRADLATGTSLEELAVADAQIDGFFAARNVTVTWHLDGRSVDQAAAVGPPAVLAITAQQYAAAIDNGTVPGWKTQVEVLIFPEGDFLFLDGGQIDLGVVRDSTLNEVNAYETFKETFEGVAHRGIEALQVISNVTPDGTVGGTVALATS